MRHSQYNTTYPLGAFIYDPRNQVNIFGDNLDRPKSINPSRQISKDDLLIELIAMEVWMELKKITDTKNDYVAHMKKILDRDTEYNFYITDQSMGMVDGPHNINFHSIVNRLISPDKLQFTKFYRTIDWLVIPLFGNIERYSPPIKSMSPNNYTSYNDCMKGNQTQQSVRMTGRRNVMNNLNHRSHIIKNLKYVRNKDRNKDRNNQENVNDCIEQSIKQCIEQSIKQSIEQDIWIRDIDGIERFGPETTGKVMMHGLFNMLYFISLVRVIGNDTISITLHRINPIKYGTY